jgi:hypothetical protein
VLAQQPNHITGSISSSINSSWCERTCVLTNWLSGGYQDRLPTPFGLVRTGVAPDHEDTKVSSCQASSVLRHKLQLGNQCDGAQWVEAMLLVLVVAGTTS